MLKEMADSFKKSFEDILNFGENRLNFAGIGIGFIPGVGDLIKGVKKVPFKEIGKGIKKGIKEIPDIWKNAKNGIDNLISKFSKKGIQETTENLISTNMLKEMAGSFKKSFEDILNFGEHRLNFAGIGKIDDNLEKFSNSTNRANNNGSGVEIKPRIKNYTYKNGRYEKADYHGKTDNSIKNKAPIDGQDALDNSIEINSNTKRRIAISNNEIVILDETINGIYHGHVRKWEELSPKMRAVLIKAGLVNKKGKIK